jgi:ankyrin repeat protein
MSSRISAFHVWVQIVDARCVASSFLVFYLYVLQGPVQSCPTNSGSVAVLSKPSLALHPLSLAAANGRGPVIKLLLGTDAVDPDFKDNDGRTQLSWAAGKGHEAVVRLLLATKANVNSQSSDGRTPLILAAKNGYDRVVKLLLENHADSDAEDYCGTTVFSCISSRSLAANKAD